jgi:hypothetical protein
MEREFGLRIFYPIRLKSVVLYKNFQENNEYSLSMKFCVHLILENINSILPILQT